MDEKWQTKNLAAFQAFRSAAYGRETYQTFATLDKFFRCDQVNDLPAAVEAITWTAEIESPLRPESLALLRRFAAAGREIRAYRSLSGAVDKRDALTRAALDMRAIEKASGDLPPPENKLIAGAAKQWAELIAAEQEALARPRPVRKIVSRYIIGPPLRPEHGRLFAGRNEAFREIGEWWENPLLKHSLVIHGERRMGKTSILHHLHERLGPEYIPVYANLQVLAGVRQVGTFLYNLADTIHAGVEAAPDFTPGPAWPERPRQQEYGATPFVPFRHFMASVNQALGDDHWLALLLDEFEMIESKLAGDVFSQDLLFHFREAMMHWRRTALVFAGCHTLERMTHRYWSPFFGVTRNLKVSYLSRPAAEALIANPWDGFELNYEPEAIAQIMAAAGRQPMLLQETCQAIIQHINQRLRRTGAQTLPTVSAADVAAVMPTVLDNSTYFRGVWDDPGLLKPYERVALAALAELQTQAKLWVSRPDVDGRLHPYLDNDEIERAWSLLAARDMVDVNGLNRRFTVELVRRWARKFQPLAEVAAGEGYAAKL